MALTTTKSITVEQLEREGAPDGRWELIDGELVEMPPSGGEASNFGTVVSYYLTEHVRSRHLGKIYGADGGFVLFPGRQMVRVPDVAFVRAGRLPSAEEQRRFLRLAPDLVLEVVSPSDLAADVLAKAMLWLEAGVRLVWLVDPRSRTITAYAADGTARVLREGDALDGGEVLPDFRVPVAELFA